MKIRKEIKIGFVVLVAGLLLFWGVNFLKGSSVFSSDYLLYAHYKNVAGLGQSDPVILNGYKIGQVDNIKFAPEGDGSLIVTLKIVKQFPIPDNSVAKIVNTSITGSKGIEVFLGNSTSHLKDDDTIQSGTDNSLIDSIVEELMPLKDKIEFLVERLDRTAQSLNAILDEETQQNVIASLESFRVIMQTVAEQRHNINAIMGNARDLTGNLEEDRKKLSVILDNIAVITEDLSQANIAGTVNHLNQAVTAADSLLVQLQQGNGTLGQLMTDDALYSELTTATEQLRLLIEDVKQNPKKYVKLSLF